MAERAEDIHTVFFGKLGEDLSRQEGVDTELAEILKRHLLQTTPAEDCVEKAQEAILELAAKRAASQLRGAND